MTLDGGGAPATTMRTPRSPPGMDWPFSRLAVPASSTAATTAGAPHISVTPSFSMRLRISSPSTLRSTTCFTPKPVMA